MTELASGPARVFAEHRLLFGLAVGAAALAGLAFARRAARRHGLRRLGWGLLAAGEAAQVAGMVRARRRGQDELAEGFPAWS